MLKKQQLSVAGVQVYVCVWLVYVCVCVLVCVYVSVSGFCLKLGGLAMIIYNLKHVANARWHEFSLSSA